MWLLGGDSISGSLIEVHTRLLFGGGSMFGLTVIDNVMAVINGLGGAGFAGLVGLCVLFSLLTAK